MCLLSEGTVFKITLQESLLLCVVEGLEAVLSVRFDAPGHDLTVTVPR